jgi:spore germination protein GerM
MIATCLLVGAGLVGCAVRTESEAQRIRKASVPFDLLDPEAPPLVAPAPEGAAERVTLCFVHERRLVLVSTELTPPVTLRASLDALAAPPADAGSLVRTALADPSILREVRLLGGIARVDLTPDVSALPTDEQLLAVAQIVCTLTGRPGVGQVSFSLQGTPLAGPNVAGSLVTSPLARDDYAALMQ